MSAVRLLPVALGSLCLTGAAAAAGLSDAGVGLGVGTLEPRAGVTQTFTDNQNPGAQGAGGDAVTRLMAGVGWRGRSGAVRGFLDYALTGIAYARNSERNELQNALSANVVADLIENRLQVVSSATISRSAISAFGIQPGTGGESSSNVTEARSFQVAPVLRGALGSLVRYDAALSHTRTSAASTTVGDSSSTTASLHLEPLARARLGWSLDASRSDADFSPGRATRNDRLFGGVRLALSELDLQLTATGGTETSNLTSLQNQRYNTWGVGLDWIPSPVTRVNLQLEDRFFGRAHAVLVEHRTPRTVFRLRSARSVSTTGSQSTGLRVNAAALFDSLYAYLDKAQRDVAVAAALARLNYDTNTTIDFLRSAASLQDTLEFSAAWTGPRDMAVLLANRTKTRRIDALSSAIDDLARVAEVSTTTLALNLTHRLTPLSNAGLVLSAQRASSGQAGQSTRQTSADLNYSVSLTPQSSASLGVRRAHFSTGLQSYDETAITANYAVRF